MATRVLRAFRKLGFEVDHITGSHHIMLHPDGRRVSVSRHQRVKTGLLLAQLKRAQVTWEEFSENL
ncbi:MAG TPA: type II toxin-antitoxin system HicA family toxin [Dehalococcoidia bacterium]|nr:type II toxin-antitoxin system HicA family toxin [Dehalococcoidia bacterium]